MAYQHAPFISQCLDSVLNQNTSFRYEIILGEDDSTDGTREICRRYAEQHPDRIRLFLRNARDRIFIDGQQTGRFNFIENLKAARGAYIALLDGDDYWSSPEKIERMTRLMEANPRLSLAFHRTMLLRHKQEPVPVPDLGDTPGTFNIAEIMRPVNIMSLHTSNCLFRRSCIDTIPAWFYEVPFLDVPLYVHTGMQGRVGYLAEYLSVYRVHERGMWRSRKEPANYLKQWKQFTLLAEHTEGYLRDVMLERRHRVGSHLVNFYKKHLWMDRGVFSRSLQIERYEGDRALLKELDKFPGPGQIVFSAGSLLKNIFTGTH
jgi:glycosyltransferase involved in cell wall biosynthesis